MSFNRPLININEAVYDVLLNVPNIGPASAREIEVLRERLNGRLSLDDFKTLKIAKRHPLTAEYFDFSPGIPPTMTVFEGEDLEEDIDTHLSDTSDVQQIDQASGGNPGPALTAARDNQSGFQLIERRLTPDEMAEQLERTRMSFENQLELLRKQFDQQRKEEQAIFEQRMVDMERRTQQSQATACKAEAENAKLRDEIAQLATLKTTPAKQAPPPAKQTLPYFIDSHSGSDESVSAVKVAVQYDQRIQQAQQHLINLNAEKEHVVRNMESAARMTSPPLTQYPVGPYREPPVPSRAPPTYHDYLKHVDNPARATPGRGGFNQRVSTVKPGRVRTQLSTSLSNIYDTVEHHAPGGLYRRQPEPIPEYIPRYFDQQPLAGHLTPPVQQDLITEPSPVSVRGNGGEVRVRGARDQGRGMSKPPIYTGKGRWRSFYLQFSTYCKLRQFNDQQKVDELCLCLKDDAVDFYECQPLHIRNNYNLIIGKLEQRFGKKDLPATLRLQFQQLRQKIDESLEEWAERVQRLAQEAFIDLPEDFVESETIARFCQGLQDKEAAQFTSDACPATIESALRSAKRHIQNSKVIFGSRKTVRQLSCQHCQDSDTDFKIRALRDERNSGSCHSRQESIPGCTGCSLNSLGRDTSINCGIEETAVDVSSSLDDLVVRRMNSPGRRFNNQDKLENRLKGLEDFCAKSFERLFKMIDRPASPRRRMGSPSRACFGCGEVGHFQAECPKRGILKNKSPSPKRHGDEKPKVAFKPLNS